MIQNLSTVLVIDDADDVAQLLARFFARAKLHPVIASNGIAGLQQARTLLPSLIFCDADMPGLNGLQVIERLRADPATARIPIVLISGYEAARFYGSGADAFLQKPFLMNEMVALARRLVTRRASKSGDKALECAAWRCCPQELPIHRPNGDKG